MKDCEGWPIVPGARVRVENPEVYHRAHVPGCLGVECGCPKVTAVRHGKVRGAVESPTSGRPYVDIIEFVTFNNLTPSPASVRVMGGKTQASKRHELLTNDGLRAYKRRAK